MAAQPPELVRGITLRPQENGVPCERICETTSGLFWELRYLWQFLRPPESKRNKGSWVNVWFGHLARNGMPAAALVRGTRGGVSPVTAAAASAVSATFNDMVSTRAFLCLLRSCANSRAVATPQRTLCLNAITALSRLAVQAVSGQPEVVDCNGLNLLITPAGAVLGWPAVLAASRLPVALWDMDRTHLGVQLQSPIEMPQLSDVLAFLSFVHRGGGRPARVAALREVVDGAFAALLDKYIRDVYVPAWPLSVSAAPTWLRGPSGRHQPVTAETAWAVLRRAAEMRLSVVRLAEILAQEEDAARPFLPGRLFFQTRRTDWQTDRRTDRERQTLVNRQTDRRAGGKRETQTESQTETDSQTNREANSADKQTADRHRQTDRETDADKRAERRTDRETHRHRQTQR